MARVRNSDVAKAQGARQCFYCKSPFNFIDGTSERYPTKDHKLARSKGGRATVWACARCNNEKKDMSVAEFMKYLDVTAGIWSPVGRMLAWRRYLAAQE